MKTTRKILCLLGVLLVVAVALIYVWRGSSQSLRLRRHFDSLVKTNNHEAVARAAISSIRTEYQQGQNYRLVLKDVYLTNLPPVIAQMKPQCVTVSPEGMKIEFDDGASDHFGFEIQAQEEFWELTWYVEDQSHPLLKIRKDERSGEPTGPANGSRPIRSETNRTSSAAGSRR